MKFLKKYWWVFALIIGAFLLYWFMFREESSINPSTKKGCNNTHAQWNQKMAAKIAVLRARPSAMAKINQDVADGVTPDVEQGLAGFADWSLRVEDKQCNPNYAN